MFSVTRPLGRGCDGTGRFWVRQVVVSGSTVQKLAIDFDQHCQGSDPGLYGALRYNSDISSLIPFDGDYPRYRLDISATVNGAVTGTDLDCRGPGPACAYPEAQPAITIAADPDDGFYFTGWSGSCHGGRYTTVRLNTITQCGAVFTSVTAMTSRVLMLNSLLRDYIGKGRRHVLNDVSAVWHDTVSTFSDTQTISISAGENGGDASDIRLTISSATPWSPGTFALAGVRGWRCQPTATPVTRPAARVYMFAANAESVSGWQDRGDWIVP